jgi:hypothetical protein
MTMRALMEALQGQTSAAVGTVREGAEAEGETVDAGFEGDGESLEPVEPNAMAEEDLFGGWEEGVALVAVSDTIAYTEDGEAVEVPADTTAEVVGVALDEDPPGAVIMLDDETMLAIDAEGAVGWAVAEGDEGADLEDEGAQDLEPEEDNVSAADEEPEMEAADPLLRSLRAILDEGRKGKKKAAKKGAKECDGECACGGAGPVKGKKGKAVAEAVEPGPASSNVALAYVYALLLDDAMSQIEQGAEGGDEDYARLAKAGDFSAWSLKFRTRANSVLRGLGYSPSQLKTIAGKVQSKAMAFVD